MSTWEMRHGMRVFAAGGADGPTEWSTVPTFDASPSDRRLRWWRRNMLMRRRDMLVWRLVMVVRRGGVVMMVRRGSLMEVLGRWRGSMVMVGRLRSSMVMVGWRCCMIMSNTDRSTKRGQALRRRIPTVLIHNSSLCT